MFQCQICQLQWKQKKEHPKDVPLASNKDTIANTVGIKLTLAL